MLHSVIPVCRLGIYYLYLPYAVIIFIFMSCRHYCDVLSMREDDEVVFSVKLRDKAITVEVLPRPGHPNVTGLSNKPRFLEKLP